MRDNKSWSAEKREQRYWEREDDERMAGCAGNMRKRGAKLAGRETKRKREEESE